jgi:hypothetical protein
MATRLAVNRFGNLGIGAVQVTVFPGTVLLFSDQRSVVNAQYCHCNTNSPTWTRISLPTFKFSLGIGEMTTLVSELEPLRKGPKATARSVSKIVHSAKHYSAATSRKPVRHFGGELGGVSVAASHPSARERSKFFFSLERFA